MLAHPFGAWKAQSSIPRRALLLWAAALAAAPLAADAALPGGDDDPPGATAAQDADDDEQDEQSRSGAALVRKHLESYLQPSEVKFLKGRRVKLVYSFGEKSEKHERIFVPNLGAGIKAPFRWSQAGEDAFVGSEPGIRVSDRGAALLDCWFLDEVEAEMQFLQHINFTQRMYAAITFHNEKGRGLGSNYGTQCGLFVNGRLAKRGGGKASGVPFNVTAKIRLVIKDGVAEAQRGNSSRAKDRMKYSQKQFSSGRIGFAWGGSMSGTITRLEVTGKLDIPRMAQLLKAKLKLD